MSPVAKLQTKILTRQGKPGGYKVYRAGLEWDLTDPIVIESADDFRSKPQWHDRLKPFHHQVNNLITFCRRLPVTLLADDVGLGKTISAGLVMSELIARSRLSKVLIVCPKLLGPQWKQELEDKFGIPSEVAAGRDLLDADPRGAGAVITTYNAARLHLDALPEDRFQMLILDEAHKLRNLHGTASPPQVAKQFQKALAERRFRFVLMLTATPIHNRLWDIYSLVDLLTAARGHENPFGEPDAFAERFIAGQKARQIKSDAREEFRSVVHDYMSRTRRGDAGLLFPERSVQMLQVTPTKAELELIKLIAGSVQDMNRLTQVSILKALSSSPEALQAQLDNMARNGTASEDLAADVRRIVETMPPTAKLSGLAALIDMLRKQNPKGWRIVIFTCLRETQTAIQAFLDEKGIAAGIINGDSGDTNQDTIAGFKENPPRHHVILSTEAGSEGVNLQVSNVLINFDLPWNPMIVEQRIGRVQRLGSAYKRVSIFNITLHGTFEDFVVGRLMEKLQMAADAIGDVDSLLQGSDITAAGDDDPEQQFEERVLRLVLDALAGKDVEEAARRDADSIDKARRALEETNIDELLGSVDAVEIEEDAGPRAPRLPPVTRSMDVREFTLAAFELDGAQVASEGRDVYSVHTGEHRERICFEERPHGSRQSVLYAPHTPAFQRLVKRMIDSGVHNVGDVDDDPGARSQSLAAQWAGRIGATFRDARVTAVTRGFSGDALLRVRATVAHDSYEQLVICRCDGSTHRRTTRGAGGLEPVEKVVHDPASLGIDAAKLREAGERDEAIAEFSRFYEERRSIEMNAAGSNARKRKKLSDDFSPRIEMVLAGLEGDVGRDVTVRVRYSFEGDGDYASEIVVRPRSGRILREPETGACAKTGRNVPKECLGLCEISGVNVLQHLLVMSEFSNRTALPRFVERCQLSGKRALTDEIETSAVTGRRVASPLLRQSAAGGKRAEPEHFGVCAFSGTEVLKRELGTSEISGKPYRIDQGARSDVSGRAGHAQEFTVCQETGRTIARAEAETCEVTGMVLRPGVLETCAETGKRVLPSLLATCEASGSRVLRDRLVTSSVSNTPLRRDKAVASGAGLFCLPAEAETCLWSGRKVHPGDMRTCALTGLVIHADYATAQSPPRLRPLAEMLDGTRHMDENGIWNGIAQRLKRTLGAGTCRIEAAILSPSRQRLAASAEFRSLFGLRVSHVGAVYDLDGDAIIGRIAEGKRGNSGWVAR